MQTIKNIVLTCKDISPDIFTNYAVLLNKQENMANEIEVAKKELISLGVDPDDESTSNQLSLWPYMDSEVEKLHQKIKIAQLKLSKCIFEYELLKNESSKKFYEFQKVNSQIMEMLVYVIQEIAYKEEQQEQKKLNYNKKNNISEYERLYISDDDDDEADDIINPDFPKTNKDKKIQSILLMITRIEPFLIIVLSVLLLIHYQPGLSVM
jgi:hypothetical protein